MRMNEEALAVLMEVTFLYEYILGGHGESRSIQVNSSSAGGQ